METDITSVMSLSSLIVIPIVDWLELLLRASQCLLVSKAREANMWTLSIFQQNEKGKESNEYSGTTAIHTFWIYTQGNISDLTLDLTWLNLMYEHFTLFCFYIALLCFTLLCTNCYITLEYSTTLHYFLLNITLLFTTFYFTLLYNTPQLYTTFTLLYTIFYFPLHYFLL